VKRSTAEAVRLCERQATAHERHVRAEIEGSGRAIHADGPEEIYLEAAVADIDEDRDERWAVIEWTPDAAKRLVGQRVDRPVVVEEKTQAVTDLTGDEEVAYRVTVDLLSRPPPPTTAPSTADPHAFSHLIILTVQGFPAQQRNWASLHDRASVA
jgi:hypothetical protein